MVWKIDVRLRYFYERRWDPKEMMELVVFCKLMLKYIRTAAVTGRSPIDPVPNTMVNAL